MPGSALPEPAQSPVNPRLTRLAPVAVGAVLFLGALALYVATLAPSVMPGDYAEFQFSAAILGVPHPTGYPLYILLGKLFTLLPVGDVAYRVNLSSAVYMAGAVALGYAGAVRLLRFGGLGRAWPAAAVGAALFAVAPTPWSMALVARSYALNALLVGGVVLALVSWRGTGRPAWFYAACLLVGFSLVHHGTNYLLLPAYGLYLLWVERERWRRRDDARPWRRRLLGAAAFAAGFSPMLFLVYRFAYGSPYYWGNPTTWKDFYSMITGGPFHNQVFGFGTGLDVQVLRVAFGLSEMAAQYSVVGIALGAAGLVVLWRRLRVEAVLLALMVAANFFFAMNYSLVGYLYFIPTYLVWAMLMSVGAGWPAYELARRLSLRAARWAAFGAAGAALAVVLVWAGAARYPALDQSGQTEWRDRTLAALEAAPPDASFYLDWEEQSVVRFYRLVYGMRLDTALHSGDPADWPERLYCDLEAGVTPYVGKFAGALPPVVERDFTLEPAVLGWRVTGVRNPERYAVPPCGQCATCR
ncbi:MAG TPA: DUF2723 domain-containing protein [Chloroflexia bacterium]|nr:DUF2723 domain-containing protein [Chloroflexia bacterium]